MTLASVITHRLRGYRIQCIAQTPSFPGPVLLCSEQRKRYRPHQIHIRDLIDGRSQGKLLWLELDNTIRKVSAGIFRLTRLDEDKGAMMQNLQWISIMTGGLDHINQKGPLRDPYFRFPEAWMTECLSLLVRIFIFLMVCLAVHGPLAAVVPVLIHLLRLMCVYRCLLQIFNLVLQILVCIHPSILLCMTNNDQQSLLIVDTQGRRYATNPNFMNEDRQA